MSSKSQRTMRSARRKQWWRTYHQRMAAGLEQCRKCGSRDELTFDHIAPAAHGGTMPFENTTILCKTCNIEKGSNLWSDLVSLAEEEAAAPPEQRWAALSASAAHARSLRAESWASATPWTPQQLALLDTDATHAEVAELVGHSAKAVKNMRGRLRRGNYPLWYLAELGRTEYKEATP